jgi:hypothetical protein
LYFLLLLAGEQRAKAYSRWPEKEQSLAAHNNFRVFLEDPNLFGALIDVISGMIGRNSKPIARIQSEPFGYSM